MSRETDSSSAGPQGRGGAAYPSGTPPYGSRQYPGLHPQQDASDETEIPPVPQPDEPRTETTLTTRIRINIPGSRPIPPVVMRTPMGEGESTDGRGIPAAGQNSDRTGSAPRPDGAGQDPAGSAAPEGEPPAGQDRQPPSDWFAPRKAGAAPGPSGPGAGTAAGMGAGAAATAGGPTPPQPGAGDGSLDGYTAQAAPQGEGAPGRQGDPGRQGAAGQQGDPGGYAPGSHGTPPYGVPVGIPGPDNGPNGPTTGPATGSSPLTPLGGAPGGPGYPGGPDQGGAPRMSDDTAVLTPQQPAPEPPGGHVSGDTLTSGIPVIPPEHRAPFPGAGTSGGPQGGRPDLTPRTDDRPAPGQGFPPGVYPGPEGPERSGPAKPPAPAPAPRPAAPAKKGRSKGMLLVALLIVAAVGVYGAGLLMNHSDVPKGSTVLGVDIGGGTRDQAVNKLESTLGKQAKAPLKLDVSGTTQELAPDKAGLTLDTQATVRSAAGSDYNPVTVVGSLFGGARVVEPVIPVDQEKLTAALTDLAGTSGSATEGTVKFEPGKAVAVPGKAGQSLDVSQSMISVRDAYRTQVQTGKVSVVKLPLTSREPTISQAEIDRAMKDFAKPAMSGLVTIQAGSASIQFGPDRSLPKILSMKAVDGKLQDSYDLKALKELYGSVFDGVLITRGDGSKTAVTPQDVAGALREALRGKTPDERTKVIETDPS